MSGSEPDTEQSSFTESCRSDDEPEFLFLAVDTTGTFHCYAYVENPINSGARQASLHWLWKRRMSELLPPSCNAKDNSLYSCMVSQRFAREHVFQSRSTSPSLATTTATKHISPDSGPATLHLDPSLSSTPLLFSHRRVVEEPASGVRQCDSLSTTSFDVKQGERMVVAALFNNASSDNSDSTKAKTNSLCPFCVAENPGLATATAARTYIFHPSNFLLSSLEKHAAIPSSGNGRIGGQVMVDCQSDSELVDWFWRSPMKAEEKLSPSSSPPLPERHPMGHGWLSLPVAVEEWNTRCCRHHRLLLLKNVEESYGEFDLHTGMLIGAALQVGLSCPTRNSSETATCSSNSDSESEISEASTASRPRHVLCVKLQHHRARIFEAPVSSSRQRQSIPTKKAAASPRCCATLSSPVFQISVLELEQDETTSSITSEDEAKTSMSDSESEENETEDTASSSEIDADTTRDALTSPGKQTMIRRSTSCLEASKNTDMKRTKALPLGSSIEGVVPLRFVPDGRIYYHSPQTAQTEPRPEEEPLLILGAIIAEAYFITVPPGRRSSRGKVEEAAGVGIDVVPLQTKSFSFINAKMTPQHLKGLESNPNSFSKLLYGHLICTSGGLSVPHLLFTKRVVRMAERSEGHHGNTKNRPLTLDHDNFSNPSPEGLAYKGEGDSYQHANKAHFRGCKECDGFMKEPALSSPLHSSNSLVPRLTRPSPHYLPKHSFFDENFDPVLLLGRGQSGAVLLARHRVTGIFYAVKVLVAKDYESERDILQEVRVHAMLSSPYIVRYHACWSELITPMRAQQLVFIGTCSPRDANLQRPNPRHHRERHQHVRSGAYPSVPSGSAIDEQLSRGLDVSLSTPSNSIWSPSQKGRDHDWKCGAPGGWLHLKVPSQSSFRLLGTEPISSAGSSFRTAAQPPHSMSVGVGNLSRSCSEEHTWGRVGVTKAVSGSCESFLSAQHEDYPDDGDDDADEEGDNDAAPADMQRTIIGSRVVFLQMEFCQVTLAHLLDSRAKIDRMENIVIILQIIEGLSYLHKCGILHRDLKPTNIFLDYRCQFEGPFHDAASESTSDDEDDRMWNASKRKTDAPHFFSCSSGRSSSPSSVQQSMKDWEHCLESISSTGDGDLRLCTALTTMSSSRRIAHGPLITPLNSISTRMQETLGQDIDGPAQCQATPTLDGLLLTDDFSEAQVELLKHHPHVGVKELLYQRFQSHRPPLTPSAAPNMEGTHTFSMDNAAAKPYLQQLRSWITRRLTQARLGDFGLAKFLYQQELQVDGFLSPNSHNTVGAGSPLYASPEQLKGNICTPSSDIFSLGVVMAEMYLQPTTTAERIHVLRSTREGRYPDKAAVDLYPELRIVRRLAMEQPNRRMTLKAARRYLQTFLEDLLRQEIETEFS